MIAGSATREALLASGDRHVMSLAGGDRLTGLELEDRVGRLASSLMQEGLEGKRVGHWYLNSLESLEAHLALERIGATRVPVDPGAPSDEAERVFELTDVVAVISDGRDTVPQPTLVHTTDSGLYDTKSAPPTQPPESRVEVLFVRGTTGNDVIRAPMTYANWEASISHNINLYRSDWYGRPIDADDCFLTTQQLMHGSSILGWMPFIRMGLPQVILQHFEARSAIDALNTYGVTSTFMVPAMITRVVEALKPSERLERLTRLLYGGAPMAAKDLDAAMRALGPVLIQQYGKWECGWPLTVLTQHDHELIASGDRSVSGSCGRRVPGVEITLEPVSGQTENVRELCVRSPMVIDEYADTDGWYRTTDLATRDSRGYYFLQGRIDGMINTGGFHVYPVEVEAAISSITGVSGVLVRGEDDPKWGQAVTAYVVGDRSMSSDDIRSQLRHNLAAYKIPTRVEFVDRLPA